MASSRPRAADANDNKNVIVYNSFMVSSGCSNVANFRVEQAILDVKGRRNAAQIRNSPPARQPLARELLMITRPNEPRSP
jgi:hypothetical protein